jgi:hypothetical protein
LKIAKGALGNFYRDRAGTSSADGILLGGMALEDLLTMRAGFAMTLRAGFAMTFIWSQYLRRLNKIAGSQDQISPRFVDRY